MTRLFAAVASALFLLPALAVAEPIPDDRKPTLTLTVDPPAVSVGEVIEWKLEVKHRVGDKVHMSDTASFGSLSVRDREIVEGEAEGEWTTQTLRIELIAFDAGEEEIPAQQLTLVCADTRTFPIETEAALVSVRSLIDNEPEPELKEDLGEGEKVFEEDYTLLWVLGSIGAIGVIALLTLLGRWIWSKRGPRPEPPPPPPRPAHKIALEKLEKLRRSNLLEKGHIKEFHVRLSEAIREYLGNRFEFDSLELSTEELVEALQKTAISEEDYERTTQFLEETDLVKFAKMLLSTEESRIHLERSIKFVNATKKVQFQVHDDKGTDEVDEEDGDA